MKVLVCIVWGVSPDSFMCVEEERSRFDSVDWHGDHLPLTALQWKRIDPWGENEQDWCSCRSDGFKKGENSLTNRLADEQKIQMWKKKNRRSIYDSIVMWPACRTCYSKMFPGMKHYWKCIDKYVCLKRLLVISALNLSNVLIYTIEYGKEKNKTRQFRL